MTQPTDHARAAPRWLCALEVLLVFAVFAWAAGWPPPDPNEPHYLGKAKHFWNPGWIVGDYFLDSPDAHQVFYWTCGWLTLFFPLVQVAWIGRVATWLLMAVGWWRMSRALVPQAGSTVLSALLFVAANERLQLAGEWVVGGFEAKGIAYALVFFALAELAAARWNRVWLLLGGAAAFHVLVGGWAVVAAGLASFMVGRRDTLLVKMLPGLVGGGALSLFGLWPIVQLSRGIEPRILRLSELCYFERLPHHLDFLAFKPEFMIHHGLLLVAWLLLCRINVPSLPLQRLRWFVAGALAIAAGGIVLSLATYDNPDWGARLLRFYWFRLTDAALPLGVAIEAAYLVSRRTTASESAASPAAPSRRFWLVVAWGLAAAFVYQSSGRLTSTRPRADKPDKTASLRAWRDACAWIRQNTPADARFFTPRNSQTFRWYAERPEVGNWKDIPQDPQGLVEWRLRMQNIFYEGDPCAWRSWYESPGEKPLKQLLKLAKKYDADYVVCPNTLDLEPYRVYRNNFYAVYRIRSD